MIRAFLAVPLPISLRAAVAEVQAVFQHEAVSWRWVLPEHIHLTLKFLGEVPTHDLTRIVHYVERSLAAQESFTVQTRAVECFPSPSRPRVLWIGLNDPDGHLIHLQRRIETALQLLGFAPEHRPFRPHLTLARASRVQRNKHLASLLYLYQERFFGEFPVTQCQVFQSHLHPQSAVYTVLQTITFQG